MIELHTLGDAMIKVGEKEIRPTAPLVFAALLYLGMERGRRVPRAALQELLFPNADERSGAHSLRQLLYKLRQLGAPVEADGASVFVPPNVVSDPWTADFIATRDPAVVGQGFAPSYSPALSGAFRDWIQGRRDIISSDIRQLLSRRIAQYRNELKWRDVEHSARALLAVDPLNEEATLALAECEALAGSKNKAVNLLLEYESETKRSDLRLSATLLRRRISENFQTSNTAHQSPFLGRDGEIALTRDALCVARSGVPSVIVFGGDPGIGKTRVVDEIAGASFLEGITVHVVRCQPHYSQRPLAAFIELVPALLNSPGALGIHPVSMAQLNRLTSASVVEDETSVDIRDDASRLGALQAALRDLLQAVSEEFTTLLVVEDVHWLDTTSITELLGAADGRYGSRLLVLLTTRNLQALRGFGVMPDRVTFRNLSPLDRQSMASLAHFLVAEANGESGAIDLNWYVESAGGNPLFLRMLCDHFINTGELFVIPADLRSAIAARVERLSLPQRRILELSAALRRRCSIDALQVLSGFEPLELLEHVQKLEEDGYLQMSGDAAEPSHHLLGDSALTRLPPLSRRILHRCAADYLEKCFSQNQDVSLLWDCAEQWLLSGDSPKALQYLRRCAQHAASIGQASQALEVLNRAKPLAKDAPAMRAVLRDMLLTARASGNWPVAAAVADELPLWSRDCSDPHDDAELIGFDARWRATFDTQSIEALTECVRHEVASAEHRMEAALLLLKVAHEYGDRTLADQTFAEVSHLVDADSIHYANRIFPLIYHTSFGDRQHAISIARKLRGDLPRFATCDGMRAATNLSLALSMLGQPREGLSVAFEYYERCMRERLTGWASEFCCMMCNLNVMFEDFVAAEQWFKKFDDHINALSDGFFGRRHLGDALELAIARQDLGEATDRLTAVSALQFRGTLRGQSYLRGAEMRVAQLDPQFQLSENQQHEYLKLYHEAKSLASADGISLGLAEDYLRKGLKSTAHDLLADYIDHRRELGPIPPSLRRVCDAAALDVPADSPAP